MGCTPCDLGSIDVDADELRYARIAQQVPRDAPTAATEIEPDRVLRASLPSLLEAGNEICCATRSDAEEFNTRAIRSDPSTQSGGREGKLVVRSKSRAKVE